MQYQSLGRRLRQEASKKGYTNIYISQITHIHETTVSKHLNDKIKVSDSDLQQYCKLFQLSYSLLRESYDQMEYYVCEKETKKKVLAGLVAVGVGAGVTAIAYNVVKKSLDENCSSRYLTT